MSSSDEQPDQEAAWHWTARAAAGEPNEPGRSSVKLFSHGTLSLRYYAPRGYDAQVPHDQDEVYVVITGKGRFRVGDRLYAFGPGDMLFAPAGMEHRFEDFSEDFATWVMFYGPKGGEAAT